MLFGLVKGEKVGITIPDYFSKETATVAVGGALGVWVSEFSANLVAKTIGLRGWKATAVSILTKIVVGAIFFAIAAMAKVGAGIKLLLASLGIGSAISIGTDVIKWLLGPPEAKGAEFGYKMKEWLGMAEATRKAFAMKARVETERIPGGEIPASVHKPVEAPGIVA